jgi:hypothetical protein
MDRGRLRARRRRHIAAQARFGVLALASALACAAFAQSAIEDRYASDRNLRRFVDSTRGDAVAVDLARLELRKRWEEVLDETLYLIAPRGAWDEKHPAWKPARNALAAALRHDSAQWIAENRAEIRLVVNEQSMRVLSEDERRHLTEFFETPWGSVFRDRREAGMHEKAFGLPFGIEGETQAEVARSSAASAKALTALDGTQGGDAVDAFVASSLIKRYFFLQNDVWAAYVANVMRSELASLVAHRLDDLAQTVRTAVPAVPARSDKAYLGTVAMGTDRGFTVIVEHYAHLRLVGKYTLTYGPSDLHWNDIAAAVPGIKPGEMRPIFRDAKGRLGDRP